MLYFGSVFSVCAGISYQIYDSLSLSSSAGPDGSVEEALND